MGYYKNLIENLNLIPGDNIVIASDLFNIAYYEILNNRSFNVDVFLDAILDFMGTDSTIFIPCFNWNFCKGEPFDYEKTKSMTGALGNAALKHKNFKRTKHPIYSFVIAGKYRDYLCDIDYIDAFGKDSIFDFLYNNNAKQVYIDVQRGFSMLHYFEYISKIKYRYTKYFKSKYIENNTLTLKTYSMTVRKLELNVDFNSKLLFKYFFDKKCISEISFNNITCYIIDICKIGKYILNDFADNKLPVFVEYNNKIIDKKEFIVTQCYVNFENFQDNDLFIFIKTNFLGELLYNDKFLYYINILGYNDSTIKIFFSIRNRYDLIDVINIIDYIYDLRTRVFSYIIYININKDYLYIDHKDNFMYYMNLKYPENNILDILKQIETN